VNCEVSDCSLVNCHIVRFCMWHSSSASAARIRHKPCEQSEMKVTVFINNFHCWTIWPSGMECCVTGLVVWMFLKNHSTLFLTVQHSIRGLVKLLLTYLLTPWCRVLEKLTGLQLVKKFPHFTEPESSLTHPQASATRPYPGPAQSSPHTHIPLPGDPF